MTERYPGYDVLSKRHTPSWNEVTRRVIERRLCVPRAPRRLTPDEFALVNTLADLVTPQPDHRARIPVAALLDERLSTDRRDGYRPPEMPRELEAWRRGLSALEAESRSAHGRAFNDLSRELQQELLRKMQHGELHHEAWRGMPPASFFSRRLLNDIVSAYWSHPTAWNEVGWGGPASPRGYVRMGYDERDPWEAAEVHGDDVAAARRRNSRVG